MKLSVKEVTCYSDGSCLGNPGPGGWAVLMRYKNHEKTLSGSEPETTNNRMELKAAIEALRAITPSCRVTIVTDSQYVKNGITTWVANWKNNGWKTANRKPVKNVDLWLELEEEVNKHEVIWEWVKGHSGHPENDIVDQLAKDAIQKMLSEN